MLEGNQARTDQEGRESGPAARLCERADWLLRLSPNRLLLLVLSLIFLGEAAVMRLLLLFPPLSGWGLALLDATSLLIILSPAYLLLFRPLKKHHAARQRSQREAAHLSRQLLRVTEEERRALAYELHEECGQTLTALQFGIETLKASLPDTDAVSVRQCHQLAALTSGLSDQLRRLTAQLRPALLESSGIGETFRWHVQQVRRQHPDLRIDLQVEGAEARPSAEVEITLYRVLQEGLNNVVRHAQATRVTIRLRCGDTCELTLRDDGIGFDPDQVWAGDWRGLGLLGMRERVAILQGRFSLDSAPGRGTVLRALFPAFPEVTT